MPSFTHWMNFSSPELADRLYGGKEALLKSRDSAIDFYQRKDCTLAVADGERFRYGKTETGFSPPIDHGEAGTKEEALNYHPS